MPSEGGIKASTFVWSNLRGFVVAICTLPSLIMYIARMQDFDMQVRPDQGTPIAQLGAIVRHPRRSLSNLMPLMR